MTPSIDTLCVLLVGFSADDAAALDDQFEAAGDPIELREAPAEAMPVQLAAMQRGFDLVVIDGNASYKQVHRARRGLWRGNPAPCLILRPTGQPGNQAWGALGAIQRPATVEALAELVRGRVGQ